MVGMRRCMMARAAMYAQPEMRNRLQKLPVAWRM
jgi:hypothetical protein